MLYLKLKKRNNKKCVYIMSTKYGVRYLNERNSWLSAFIKAFKNIPYIIRQLNIKQKGR